MRTLETKSRTILLAALLLWGAVLWPFLTKAGAQAPGQPAPPPRSLPPGTAPLIAMLPPERIVPITLTAALQLAELSNLDIAQAREVVNQALAAQLRARATAIPNLQTGAY